MLQAGQFMKKNIELWDAIIFSSSFNKTNITPNMIKNFIKIAMRSLLKHKSSTFINISGLAIGLAATIMILMWIQHELSYDKFYTDYDLIYRVEQDQSYGDGDPYHVTVTPVPSGPVWKNDIAEITDFTRVSGLPRLLFERGDLKMYESNFRAVDSSFFLIFDFKFIYGEPGTALNEPHSIVITKETAEKYFGDENPIGERLTVERQMEFVVTGVIENLPDNTIHSFDGVIPYEFLYEVGVASDDTWGSNSILTYVKLVNNANLEHVGEKLTQIINDHRDRSSAVFMVNPIHRIRLHGYFGYASPVGAVIYVYIFGAISIFVLLIACINFINLSTARSANRSKEIGIKKVSGAQKKSIMLQFLIESVMQVMIALFVALILVGLLIGVFNTTAGKSFSIADIFRPEYIIGYLLLSLFTGLVAGLYPSFYLSSFKPLEVLKGERSGGTKSGRLRKVLVIIQFVLSVFLATCGLVIFSQVKYMREIDLGYDKDNTIVISMMDNVKTSYPTLKKELERHPLIEGVTASGGTPYYLGSNSGGADWEGKDPEKRVLIGFNRVDFAYTKTMGIKIKYGRPFTEDYPSDMLTDSTAAFLINEEVAKLMGVENPVGLRFDFGVSGTVIGVMENFYFKPASEVIEPIVFVCSSPEPFNFIVVRISENGHEEALAALEEIWADIIPAYPLDYSFIADKVDDMYRAETRMGDLFKYFTILAILLAAMGLYGLSSFIAEQKSREIGIRKVMGASVFSVVSKLTSEFLILVGIALLIGLPIAIIYLNKWLQDFPYRSGISPILILLVALISLSVAAIAVSFQSFRAGRTNPADTLRIE